MAKKTTTRKPVRVLKKKAVPKTPSKKKAAEDTQVQDIVFDPRQHALVPKHEVLDQEQVQEFFTKFHVSPQNLPVILADDPGLAGMEVRMGDIVRITRRSPTAGETVFYRRVSYE